MQRGRSSGLWIGALGLGAGLVGACGSDAGGKPQPDAGSLTPFTVIDVAVTETLALA